MKDVILKHCLLNAVQHEGKANFQAVLSKILGESPKLKSDIKMLAIEIQKVLDEINSWSLEKQKNEVEKLNIIIENKPHHKEERVLPDLSNVEKNIIMRMAPFPSGPLHIGNARMAILNDEYVKKYHGKLFLVIDDTIGSEEKIPISEAYGMIKNGLKWLGIKWNKVFYKSDRLEIFYKYAKKMLEINVAYVCECPTDKLRKNRRDGTECYCRSNDAKTNIEKWEMMLKGGYKEGEAIVRLKTDMNHENPAFRDRVLLRISNREHPRVGNKYKVWPMLEFSWAIDDHFLGITHIIRGKDLIIEDMMEIFIWNLMGWEMPELLHYGLLSLEGAKLSKSKSQKSISEGQFSGWEDPRTWSLQSLRKRGIKPEAIRNFILNFGMSMNDITAPDNALYNENRKLIESEANRYFFVQDPIQIKIKNSPKIKIAEESFHPDFPERGKRKIHVNLNKIFVSKNDFEKLKTTQVRLIGLFNVLLDKNSNFTGNEIEQDIPKIQWVSDKNINVKVTMVDGSIINGVGELDMKRLKVGEIVQLTRMFYARVDKKNKNYMQLFYTHK
ncbi:MAG: glutamate--tRNA ligase [Candidatus Aenigmarchaeota archaeon]|nr:glutamate--tRNA ligase [Candidatus Aenigmarchaeota archaeon]